MKVSKIAYQIRHLPIISKAEWLWDFLRQPYHYLLNINKMGVLLELNDSLIIRIPPQYHNVLLPEYEKEATNHLVSWLKKNEDCYIMDIGCASGYISAVCLFASEKSQVVGFDSDPSSLKASQLMTQYASGNRFNTVYGLIAEEPTEFKKLNEAIIYTNTLIDVLKVTGKPGTTKYINLDRNLDGKVPVYKIDDLYKEVQIDNKHTLIKCDVEGAELLVLKGAREFISKYQPSILLSVHPTILPVFKSSVKNVEELLESIQYSHTILEIDHEEHWWCEPRK